MLSLLTHKVEEKKYDFEVTLAPGRLLQEEADLDELTSSLTLTVLAEPANEVYPTPFVSKTYNYCF